MIAIENRCRATFLVCLKMEIHRAFDENNRFTLQAIRFEKENACEIICHLYMRRTGGEGEGVKGWQLKPFAGSVSHSRRKSPHRASEHPYMGLRMSRAKIARLPCSSVER